VEGKKQMGSDISGAVMHRHRVSSAVGCALSFITVILLSFVITIRHCVFIIAHEINKKINKPMKLTRAGFGLSEFESCHELSTALRKFHRVFIRFS